MPNRIRQFVSLGRLIVRHPSAAAAAARWKPFSVTAFGMAKALKAQRLRPELVVDGGANAGQFARAMAETFPQTRVVSFEPLPEVAARFRSAFAGEARVRLVEAALGAAPGVVPFHRNPYSLASSALPVLDGSGPTAAHAETIEVPLTTLDLALEGDLVPASTLVKLDLQGFELEALRGATDLLGRASHVLLEVGLRPSYEGEPTFEALLDFLRPFGFRFLRPIDVLTDRSGEIVQMDALFGRASA